MFGGRSVAKTVTREVEAEQEEDAARAAEEPSSSGSGRESWLLGR